MSTRTVAAVLVAACLASSTGGCDRSPPGSTTASPPDTTAADGGRDGALGSAPTPDPRIVAHWGGRARGLVVLGDRAFFGQGMRLAVADVSRPAAPGLLAQSAVMAGAVRDIRAADGLIVALVDDHLQVVDVAQPSQPTLRGRVAVRAPLLAFDAAGQYATLLAEGGRLHVVDLSDADRPVEIAGLDLPGAVDVAMADDRTAFVVGETLVALDLHRPAKPRVVGRAPIQGVDIALDGGRAFVVGVDGIYDAAWSRVVDVRNPRRMRQLHEDTTGRSRGRLFAGGRLYAADMAAPDPCCPLMTVFDVRDPAATTVVGEARLSVDGLSDLLLVGDRLYGLSAYHGLVVVDVSAPHAPREMGLLAIVGSANDVAVDGRTAFGVTGRPNGGYLVADHRYLDAFDLVDATAPRHGARLELAGLTYAVAVDGRQAVLRGSSTTTLVDVGDPNRPRPTGSYRSAMAQYDQAAVNRDSEVVVRGDVAWETDLMGFAGVPGAIERLDLTDPARPRLVERIDLNLAPIGLAWAGDHLYVAERPEPDAVRNIQSGVRVFAVDGAIDVPARKVGYVPVAGKAADVAVAGDRLYVLDGALRIFDRSAPSAPVPLGSLPFDADASFDHVAVDGTTVYVGAGHGTPQVHVVDASDPTAPRVVETFDRLPGNVRAMQVTDAGLLVALGDGGFAVLRQGGAE